MLLVRLTHLKGNFSAGCVLATSWGCNAMIVWVSITGWHICVNVPHPLIHGEELLYIVGHRAKHPACKQAAWLSENVLLDMTQGLESCTTDDFITRKSAKMPGRLFIICRRYLYGVSKIAKHNKDKSKKADVEVHRHIAGADGRLWLFCISAESKKRKSYTFWRHFYWEAE